MSEVTIEGAWNGLYACAFHPSEVPPIHFEATFEVPAPDGKFRGRIVDEGGIGEAEVTGNVVGRAIRFVKVYKRTMYRTPRPIHYEGTLSEDGLRLAGTWRIDMRWLGLIPVRTDGLWRAQRPGLPEPPLNWPPAPQAG